MQRDIGAVLKAAQPQVVATLTRVLGDLDRAQDAAQDAALKALKEWRARGMPDRPVAWLITVGRNGAIDQLRRASRQVELADDATLLDVEPVFAPPEELVDEAHLWDDLLRLMFTCCHPVLTQDTQVVLTLKAILGFTVNDIARALLASPTTVERRITRAKQKLADAGVGYAVPPAEAMSERLDAVLGVVYLLFNQGYSHASEPGAAGPGSPGGLVEEAIRLARMIARMFRHHVGVRALLALMLLSAARMHGRTDAMGRFVPLLEQDRTRWDQGKIREGTAVLQALLLKRHPPNAYLLQAAIGALHCEAQDAQDTDWRQIAGLYAALHKLTSSPVVAVNHAVAIGMLGDLRDAWARIETLGANEQLQRYQPYYAARADIARRLGRREEALQAYRQAIELSDTVAERTYLELKRDEVAGG